MFQAMNAHQQAKQAAERADSIVFELLGTPRPVELLCELTVIWAKLGQHERARRCLEAARATAAAIDPRDQFSVKSAYSWIVQAAARAGWIEEALQITRSAPVDYPDDLRARAVEQCLVEGRYSDATRIARAMQTPHSHDDAMTQVAKSAMQRRQWAQGEQAARAIRHPDRRALMLLELAQQHPPKARALLQEAVQATRKVRPIAERAERLIQIADAFASLNRPQDALRLLQETATPIRQQKPYTRAWLSIQAAKVYARLQQRAQALSLLQQAEMLRARLDQRGRDLLGALLTEGYLAAQAFAQAERVLRTVSDASSRAELWLATARALRQAGRNRDAERALRFAQQAASNPYRLRQIAETQVEWGLYDAAVESARRIPARALDDACTKTRIILLLAQRRQWSDALALAEQVQDLDWRGAVLINLALEAARQGDRPRAQRVLERIPSAVLRFWGYSATMPNTLGEAQAHLQAMEQALQAIEPVAARITAHIGLAYAYAQLSKRDLARTHLQAAEQSLLATAEQRSLIALLQWTLAALGWLQLDELRAAQSAFQHLSAREFASAGEGYGFLPAAAQFLTTAGGSAIVLQSVPPREALLEKTLAEQGLWAFALIRVATTLLQIPPLNPEMEIVAGMAEPFVQLLSLREGVSGAMFILPPFTCPREDSPEIPLPPQPESRSQLPTPHFQPGAPQEVIHA